MSIRKVEIFLKIGGKILDRNFVFMSLTSLNSLTRKAFIRTHKLYAKANEMKIPLGSQCEILIALDSGDKILIFQGLVTDVVESSSDFCIEAKYEAFGCEEKNETYQGIGYGEAFVKLAENCLYEADAPMPPQIVLQGRKSRSFARLIQAASRALGKPLYFWLSREGEAVVKDRMESSKTHQVDDILYGVGVDSLILVPLPSMEIGDRLLLQGAEYRVKSLVFDNLGKAIMICGVQRVG